MAIKKTFKGLLNFNHVDPHFARFGMAITNPAKPGESEVYGRREFTITPEMFPKDFELSKYDIKGSFEFVVEISEKKE